MRGEAFVVKYCKRAWVPAGREVYVPLLAGCVEGRQRLKEFRFL